MWTRKCWKSPLYPAPVFSWSLDCIGPDGQPKQVGKLRLSISEASGLIPDQACCLSEHPPLILFFCFSVSMAHSLSICPIFLPFTCSFCFHPTSHSDICHSVYLNLSIFHPLAAPLVITTSPLIFFCHSVSISLLHFYPLFLFARLPCHSLFTFHHAPSVPIFPSLSTCLPLSLVKPGRTTVRTAGVTRTPWIFSVSLSIVRNHRRSSAILHTSWSTIQAAAVWRSHVVSPSVTWSAWLHHSGTVFILKYFYIRLRQDQCHFFLSECNTNLCGASITCELGYELNVTQGDCCIVYECGTCVVHAVNTDK